LRSVWFDLVCFGFGLLRFGLVCFGLGSVCFGFGFAKLNRSKPIQSKAKPNRTKPIEANSLVGQINNVLCYFGKLDVVKK